ncbi:hypothetical protein AMATHDRAFT_53090 [Amanita thiersii Skay4041]|uniref:Mid2 domain-containing protein n=1 Tax=Amanita thiersii Skay4041 TaxID=703135 RepID=A0A2A9P150_9AGAR|nr:hypothetical protein AMATHDRAFT_53090 [Amanita thiersii Skay4041]
MFTFASLALTLVLPCVLSQNTQTPNCLADSAFNWVYNSRKQNPCQVTEALGGACNSGVFQVPPLDPTRNQVYVGPTIENQNKCKCSTVFYATLSACSYCQTGRLGIVFWSTYITNCTAVYETVFPANIPPDIAVPHWAYENITQTDNLNITLAQQETSQPESTAGPTPTGTPSTTNSGHSSKAGPIAGGVIGGVVGLGLVAIGVLLWLRRRRRSTKQQASLGGEIKPPVLLPTGTPPPMIRPVVKHGDMPFTYNSSLAVPYSTGPTTIYTTGSSQLDSSSYISPNFTGTTMQTTPARNYPGTPEV